MRLMSLAALSIAATFAFSYSAFSQTERSKPAGTPQGTITTAPPAATAKPGDTGRPARVPGNVSAVPLTKAECTGLGGKLAESFSCSTGVDCIRADQNGVLHHSCVTVMQ
jgi:hypothetical protein